MSKSDSPSTYIRNSIYTAQMFPNFTFNNFQIHVIIAQNKI